MKAPLLPFGVEVEDGRPFWPDNGKLWWLPIYSFAAATLEEAKERGEKAVRHFAPRSVFRGPIGGTRFTVHQLCGACELTGKKPGCKRKPCPVCGGTLRLPYVELGALG